MRELSMHILDLVQNSIAAGASRVEIRVTADAKSDRLTITVADNGRGMSADFAASVKDPFVTTRTVRRVGLGIPMLAEAAEACEGNLTIESSPGNGTTVTARFRLSHIDRAPLGDVAATLVSIIAANPELSVRYEQRTDGKEFVFDTDAVRSQLDGVPITEGPVLKWIGDYVKEQARGIDD